jgi:hypothetical protein
MDWQASTVRCRSVRREQQPGAWRVETSRCLGARGAMEKRTASEGVRPRKARAGSDAEDGAAQVRRARATARRTLGSGATALS